MIATEKRPLKTNPPASPENQSLPLGDALLQKALKAPDASARYQQLDRALTQFSRIVAENPRNTEAALSCVTTRFLAAGKSKELLSAARTEADKLLSFSSGGDDPKPLHARAVALVVKGDLENAYGAFADLAAHPEAGVEYLAKARHLARHMARANGWAADSMDDAFPPLQIVVLAGHLPPKVDFGCRKLIEDELARLGASIGIASAAAGADLLFLDCMHSRGGSSHIILPWSRDSFRETSIRPFRDGQDGAVWEKLFDEALRNSPNVREIGEVVGPDSQVAWQYLLEVSAGIATQISAETHLDIVPLAVWDGTPGYPGGTADFCRFWKEQLKIEARVIAPPPIEIDTVDSRRPRQAPRRAQTHILQQAVKSMLFVDVVGFSALPEVAMPAFIEKFLHKVSEVVAASSHAPNSINTWGDAVYAVFDFVHDAGRFALELNEMVESSREEWEEAGLGPLQIRTGLHAGPVFLHHDPIVRRLGFSGAHVNRAARIEPKAAPGEILASEEFAALAAISPASGFSMEYAVTTKLVKNYPGIHRLYRVLRDRSADLLLLAKAIHEDYCRSAKEYGDTPETNAALIPWEDLPPGLQSANLAQAEDIPSKLEALGYGIADSGGFAPSSIRLDPDLVEPLAAIEHDRWMADKSRAGWIYAAERDNEKLHHPLLIPYADLPESEKEKDRATVRNIPALLTAAGYRVNEIPRE